MALPSFWEMFPDAELIEPFVRLRNKRGDLISSNILWYARFMFDPEHEYISKIPNIRELAVQNSEDQKKDKKGQREKIIISYLGLKSTDLSSSLTKEVLNWYVNYWMPPTKRTLNSITQRLFEAEGVLQKFVIETIEDIDTANRTTNAVKDFTKNYNELSQTFKEEKKAGKAGYGGKTISAAMSGALFKNDGVT